MLFIAILLRESHDSSCSFLSSFPGLIDFSGAVRFQTDSKIKIKCDDVRTCLVGAVPEVVGDAPVEAGDSEHILDVRYPVYDRVILLLEVLKTMNGLISLKLSINVTISCAGRTR